MADKKTILWLDDYRDPFENNNEWVRLFCPYKFDEVGCIRWVTSYDEFVAYIQTNGLPDLICFDHDLGDIYDKEEKTGYDCAKYLVEYCMDRGLDVPLWAFQSSNPVGKKNMFHLLNNYHNHYQFEHYDD